MSFIEFNNRNRLVPSWNNESSIGFLSRDGNYKNDFFFKRWPYACNPCKGTW